MPGVPASFDRLDHVLRDQGYRLASWRVAAEEINYRRFFDINDLAAVRMELPDRIRAVARALVSAAGQRVRSTGLRLDHTDGLYDPEAYFESLQRHFQATTAPSKTTAPTIGCARFRFWSKRCSNPASSCGNRGRSTGRRATNFWRVPRPLGGSRSEKELSRFYQRFTGDRRSFAEHVQEGKRYVLRFSLWSEVNMLAELLKQIAGKHRRWTDFTLTSLGRALSELLIAFPRLPHLRPRRGAL